MSIEEFSNPDMVLKRAIAMGIEKIKRSTRKDKKYMAWDGNKWVHFGQMGYEDYTKHKDKRRRELFRKRNARWADAPEMTPAFLAYYLLW